ncbi:MAG: branched-chain amino acid ABC transporter permease [Actinomycetota bacterium]
MTTFLQRIIDGFQNGAIYSVVAIPMVLIFKATTLINFAQGELAMIGAFFGFIFATQVFGLNVWLAAIIAMALAAALGMGIERSLLRPFDPTDHLPVVLITLGIFYIINAVGGDIWNYQAQINPPNLLHEMPDLGFWDIGVWMQDQTILFTSDTNPLGLRIQHDSIGLILSLLIMLGALYMILEKTKMGLAFRAVSSNTESSRLVGIRVGRILSFGWALACAFGALGAILVAPRITLQPNMMAPILIYALAAAAFGGLDNVYGAALGGFVVGLINSVVLGYISDVRWLRARLDSIGIEDAEFVEGLGSLTAAPLIPPVILLLTVLWFRPTGLFGTKTIARV